MSKIGGSELEEHLIIARSAGLVLFADDIQAKLDTLVANEDGRPGNKLADLVARIAAKTGFAVPTLSTEAFSNVGSLDGPARVRHRLASRVCRAGPFRPFEPTRRGAAEVRGVRYRGW